MIATRRRHPGTPNRGDFLKWRKIRSFPLLNIRHYHELLKLDRHTVKTRQRLIELLAEVQPQLPST